MLERQARCVSGAARDQLRVIPDESQPRRPFSERHVSPDGRTILELTTDYDMRDVHEMQPLLLPRVTDAATGAVVLDLTGVLVSSRFQWEADGALTLTMFLPWEREGERPAIRLALAEGTYATSADDWTPHPIGEAQAQLPALVKPPGSGPKPAPVPVGRRLWRWTKIAGWCGLWALAIWYIWKG